MKAGSKQKEIMIKVRKWAEILCCNEIDFTVVFKKYTKKEVADFSDGYFVPVAFTESNAILHIKLGELTGYLYANEEKQKADQWKGYFEERFVSQMAKIIVKFNL